VSRMQTIESGDDFWNIITDKPLEAVKGPEDARNRLVSALFFKPSQSVRRVITIGTPHRGSEFASQRITQWLARRFIDLPALSKSTTEAIVSANPGVFHETRLLTDANAIDSLAVESPIFPVMLKAKTSPQTKYHNIIGVLQNPSFLKSKTERGDGVVEYESAKMDDVESELVVDADHVTLHMTGEAIFEVRRILLEHLREIDSQDRIASLPDTTPRQVRPASNLVEPLYQSTARTTLRADPSTQLLTNLPSGVRAEVAEAGSRETDDTLNSLQVTSSAAVNSAD
ncbi:MAG: hypothetical protein AAGA03_14905, partial [Planctomycetota bacterium]